MMDIVYSKRGYVERENAEALKKREAALKKCGSLKLSCSAVDNKWGIWITIGEEKLLVNPLDLVSSIFVDDTYCMIESVTKDMPGYFMIDVEKKPYCYHWTLSHNMLDFSSENRYIQEEYVSKIFDVISQLYKAVKTGGELAYDKVDVYKESIESCYKQLMVKCTWPYYIRKTTKDIQVEEFQFDIIGGNEGERFTIGIGDRTYSTWFTHWDGDLERMRHQFETYTFEQKAEVKITFDMSETIIKLEDISVLDQVNETADGVGFKYKEYMLVTIIPNEFVKQPVFKGYCLKDQVLKKLYNGLLRMALDHPLSGNDDVPDMLNAYNMVKSPLIEGCITGRSKKRDYKSYFKRQVRVKHIITIDPDINQVFYDEGQNSYEVETNGTIDFVYDKNGNPIVFKDLFDWHSKINQIVIDSETGHPYTMDWEQYHNQGVRLAQELRKVLSEDFDLWYKAPFEDKTGTIKHPFLVLEYNVDKKGLG